MRLKDFKLIFILCFLGLFLLWLVVAFLAMGYEQGTDLSFLGKTCYKVAGYIHFSLNFWQKKCPDSIAFLASFFSSSFILSLIVFIVDFFLKFIKQYFKNSLLK